MKGESDEPDLILLTSPETVDACILDLITSAGEHNVTATVPPKAAVVR